MPAPSLPPYHNSIPPRPQPLSAKDAYDKNKELLSNYNNNHTKLQWISILQRYNLVPQTTSMPVSNKNEPDLNDYLEF